MPSQVSPGRHRTSNLRKPKSASGAKKSGISADATKTKPKAVKPARKQFAAGELVVNPLVKKRTEANKGLLQIKKIGNSTGLIFPKSLLENLKLEQGDWVTVIPTADGSLHLRRSNEVFDRGMELAEKAMKTYRNALEKLAK